MEDKYYLKCDANSDIIIPFAALRPNLCFSSSILRYHFERFFLKQLKFILIKELRTVSKNVISVKTYAAVSIAD